MKNILTKVFFFVILIGFGTLSNAALLSDGGHSDMVIAGKTSNTSLTFSLEQAKLTKNGTVNVTVLHKNKTLFSLNTSQLYVTLPDLKLTPGETYTVIVRLGNSTYQQEGIW